MSWRTRGILTFFVHGQPVAQGSMSPFKHPKTGKVMLAHRSKKLKPWRKKVETAAKLEFDGEITRGGCQLTLVFHFERPKAHYRTGKFSHLLRDDAPEHHNQKPDIDKLERAILDALTGVAYVDDCEVYAVGKTKRWRPRGESSCVEITVRGGFYAVQREEEEGQEEKEG